MPILRPGGERKLGLPFSDLHQKVALSKTFGTIRSVTSSIKSATVNAAASAAGQVRVTGEEGGTGEGGREGTVGEGGTGGEGRTVGEG